MDKNEAGSADLVPCNNDMVQRSVKANLSDIITKVCDGAKNMLKSLPPMSSAIKEVQEAEEQMKIDLVNIKATSDSKVAFMLTDLQEEFHVFIRVGKGFLQSCRSMAMYATKDEQLAEIKEQLGHEKLDKLKEYLDSLSDYLERCEASFKEFKKAHKKMVERLSSAEEHFSFQLEKAQEDTSDARGKHEEAVVKRKSRECVTTTLDMITKGGVTAGAVGLVSYEMAAFQSVLSYFSSLLARMREGNAVLDVMEQRRVREDTARKEKISQDALDCVVALYISVSKAMSVIEDMKYCTNRASAVIDQKRGLKKLAHSVPEDINFHDLENKMDMLQEYTREIVNEIGEDGIRPISKNPDELVSLVSDTRFYHETDRHKWKSERDNYSI